MTYEAIIYRRDPLLTVWIDREQASAGVTYEYGDRGDVPEQTTPFQTADMPLDDQAAARMVDEWIGS